MAPRHPSDTHGQRRYLHLLSDQDIRELRPLLEVLRLRRDAVLLGWHQRHVEHFAAALTLSKSEFIELFGRDLDALTKNLLDDDLEGFELDMRDLGHALLERGVPFAELIASLHLFEESAAEQFAPALSALADRASLYGRFDKLSHCRIILLADSYFAGHQRSTATRIADLEAEAARLAEGSAPRTRFHGLIGRSPVMQGVYQQLMAASRGQGAVFLCGESGTGKELAARAIHEASGPPERPFIAVNCAALPRELIEAELFGYRKGAYTGAHTDSIGLIRAASGGTLLLDEITEMASETQAKLLRALEERAVRPVGGARELPVDVRFIASSNRDPEQALEQGALRSDLFYRINVHRIAMPPLRERLSDVGLLAMHCARLLGSRGLRQLEGLDESAQAVLERYRWPGNVRELRSVVEYALSTGTSPRLELSDLPGYLLQATQRGAATEVVSSAPPADASSVPTMQQAEIALILRALEITGGNKLRAAQLLRISRHRLYDQLRKHGFEG
jgi:transcriptional regulator with PAS, ATPase and Fis domain